jgi:hypothetical protein
MVARGLRSPTTVTTDGAPGLIRAVWAVCSPSVRIRCWVHRLATVRAKLPDDEAAAVMAHRYAVRDAPTLDAARAAADRFASTYRDRFPAALACFEEDRKALLAIHRVPVRHRIRVRTTNLAERSVEEAPAHRGHPPPFNEKAALTLAFATMIRAAKALLPGLDQRPRAPRARFASRKSLGSTHHQPTIRPLGASAARADRLPPQAPWPRRDVQDAVDLTTRDGVMRTIFSTNQVVDSLRAATDNRPTTAQSNECQEEVERSQHLPPMTEKKSRAQRRLVAIVATRPARTSPTLGRVHKSAIQHSLDSATATSSLGALPSLPWCSAPSW